MCDNQFSCSLMSRNSLDEVVNVFLSPSYQRVIDEYREVVQKDPEYLAYHLMSTALRLQYQLKVDALPALSIGGCVREGVGRCCIIDALKEAIVRTTPARGLVERP